MKVLINIPDWKYKSICEGVEASKRCGVVGPGPVVHEAIYNGTILPKGHGRLKDIDEVERRLDLDKPDNVIAKALKNIIESVPTIVEAE
ncbi:MAG: hypothetical protein J6O00_10860 [Clostridiales bacterium]|nr:hypothetical protein [Clostridiales bacterium]